MEDNISVFNDDMKELLEGTEIQNVYSQTPVKEEPNVQPLTNAQRKKVNSLSTERGYRRFHADFNGV